MHFTNRNRAFKGNCVHADNTPDAPITRISSSTTKRRAPSYLLKEMRRIQMKTNKNLADAAN